MINMMLFVKIKTATFCSTQGICELTKLYSCQFFINEEYMYLKQI